MTNTASSATPNAPSNDSSSSRFRRLFHTILHWFLVDPIRLLILPWTVGLVWHGLHPIASICTGDMKRPRGWYIDENSLEPNHFSMDSSPYHLIQQTHHNYNNKVDKNHKTESDPVLVQSLCHGLNIQSLRKNSTTEVACHRQTQRSSSSFSNNGSRFTTFDIARVVPLSAGIAPVNEAIVVVVPPFIPFSLSRRIHQPSDNDKSRPQFQASLLQLIQRLASPQTAPWLAKTVFFVSPIHGEKNSTTPFSYHSMSPILEETVESFLNAYLGPMQQQPFHNFRTRLDERLPLEYMGAILRNLIVLDMELMEIPNTSMIGNPSIPPQTGELRILPQGRRGALPNMDLTFVTRTIYNRSSLMMNLQQIPPGSQQQYKPVEMVVHPYSKQIRAWRQWLQEHVFQQKYLNLIPLEVHDWIDKMLQLLAFEHVLAVGPFPPHAPALARGIDAITIQGVFVSATDTETSMNRSQGNSNIPARGNTSQQQHPLELVYKMEYLIRSLSNLCERLHHSTSLYLLPSPDRFIKHEEYLIPNLLLVVPLILRAALLVFQRTKDDTRLNLTIMRQALIWCISWTITFSMLVAHNYFIPSSPISRSMINNNTDTFVVATIRDVVHNRDFCLYIVFLLFTLIMSKAGLFSWDFHDIDARRSIQFLACFLCIVIHVSIAFGHVSLAFPSAMLWTPLIAFPTIRNTKNINDETYHWKASVSAWYLCKITRCIRKLTLFMATCPFLFMVPYIIPTYTIYVRYAYIPLHSLFCLQQILSEFGGDRLQKK